MDREVDLSKLAIEREEANPSRVAARWRQHLLTRYVLPLALILGFLALVTWALRDYLVPPVEVTVVPVLADSSASAQAGAPLFQAAGWIEPRPTPVRVAALAPGVVEQLLVVEDQEVSVGEPIAELVKDDAELAYQQALADRDLRQAELDEANATLVAAETRFRQPVHLEAALGEATAALARIETQLDNLPFELRRAVADQEAVQKVYEGKLAADGVVPGIEIEIAKSKAAASNALVDELRQRATSLERERVALGQRRDAIQTQLKLLADELQAKDTALAQVRAAEARVGQTRVVVAQAELQLRRMTIVAPIDGRVFRLIAHPGARVGGGSTQMADHDGSTVVTLYQPEMLQVRVDVRFEDVPKVRLGQPVTIGNAALAAPLTGKVLYISSEADIQKNTLQVKVEIMNSPSVLKPEMLVDVTFLSPETGHADRTGQADQQAADSGPARFFLPQQLVWFDGDAAFVWLADRSDNVARRQAVQVGHTRAGLVEITQGLNIASRVVVTGADRLTDGCRIRVAGEAVERSPVPSPR